jgi:hypothetical protein
MLLLGLLMTRQKKKLTQIAGIVDACVAGDAALPADNDVTCCDSSSEELLTPNGDGGLEGDAGFLEGCVEALPVVGKGTEELLCCGCGV